MTKKLPAGAQKTLLGNKIDEAEAAAKAIAEAAETD